jgi:hypothetical protein
VHAGAALLAAAPPELELEPLEHPAASKPKAAAAATIICRIRPAFRIKIKSIFIPNDPWCFLPATPQRDPGGS